MELEFRYSDGKGCVMIIEVTCKIDAGYPSYYSKSFGNYLPGENASVEISEIYANGLRVPEQLEEGFIAMVGLIKIEQIALGRVV